MSVNKVILIGHIGCDFSLKTSQAGKSYVMFNLATTEKYNNENKTTWISIKAFGKTAEIISQYCGKGSQIYIEGKLDVSNYSTGNFEKKTSVSVIVQNFNFLSTSKLKKENQKEKVTNEDGIEFIQTGMVGDDDVPF